MNELDNGNSSNEVLFENSDDDTEWPTSAVDTPSNNDISVAANIGRSSSSNSITKSSAEDVPQVSKSAKIGTLQQVFTDSQKIAYVGLCYLCTREYSKKRLGTIRKAQKDYDHWAKQFMEKLYVYINLSLEEQLMIHQLAEHGLLPTDLSKSLLQDAQLAAKMAAESQADDDTENIDSESQDQQQTRQENKNIPEEQSDIRYTVLAHMFILSVSDGSYDARERSLIQTVAKHLCIPWADVVVMEHNIARQLRVHEESGQLRKDKDAIHKQNTRDKHARWAYMGLATLAGGAVIGLTAGVAAPIIGAGMTAALTALGATGVQVGSAAGIALITTSGVLAGGGITGKSYLKRTGWLTEFEFLSIKKALEQIEKNKRAREIERRKKLKLEQKEAKEAELKEKIARGEEPEGAVLNSNVADAHLFPVDSDAFGEHGEARSRASTTSIISEGVGSRDMLFDIEKAEMESEMDLFDEEGTERDAKVIREVAPIPTERQPNVLITVAGWITYGSDDFTLPFSTISPNTYGEQYSLIWESKDLQNLGSALKILGTEVAVFLFQQGLAATVLPVLMAGLTGPLWAIKLTYLVDNPWGIGLNKAQRAGHILAETLIAQVQENRPVTLIGFSLGARLIYYCLQELASRGKYGIIEDVYIFGTPVMSTPQEWTKIASVVSGKITNGYLSKDWVLGVLYRASSGSWGSVAGLGPISDVDGVVNVCLDEVIEGHLEYRLGMPKILIHCGFNVTQDYFDDEDEQDERLMSELKETQQRQAEERLARKKEEAEKKEMKRLAREMQKNELKELGIKTNFFGTPEIVPKRLDSTLPTLVLSSSSSLASEGDFDIEEFKPKELQSTLPPLVLNNGKLNSPASPKELESTLDALHIDSKKEGANATGTQLEAQLLKFAAAEAGQTMVYPNAGPGDKADDLSAEPGDDDQGGDYAPNPIAQIKTPVEMEGFSNPERPDGPSSAIQEKKSPVDPSAIMESMASAMYKEDKPELSDMMAADTLGVWDSSQWD